MLCSSRSPTVQVTVRNVLSDGLLVTFLKFFHGFVDLFHIPPDASATWRTTFKPNTRAPARILYVDPTSKKVHLSLLRHLVAYHLPQSLPTLGAVYDAAKVLRCDKGLGLLVALPVEPVACNGYAHISNVSDEPSATANLPSAFPIGKEVAAKVTGFRVMDGLATVSLKTSDIESSDVTWDTLHPGGVVEGTVQQLADYGVLVQLGANVRGLVPMLHVSEAAAPKKLQSRLKVGQKLRCRCASLPLPCACGSCLWRRALCPCASCNKRSSYGVPAWSCSLSGQDKSALSRNRCSHQSKRLAHGPSISTCPCVPLRHPAQC